MTTPNSARAALSSPRTLAAWALVAYAALHLVFSFFDWILPGDGRLVDRSAGAGFTNLFVMAMPVVAVLIAVYLNPPLPGARLLATVALVEYAVSLVFGVLAWLIGFGSVFGGSLDDSLNDAFDGLRYLVMGIADLALIAIAAYVVYRAFTRLGGRLPVTLNRTAPPAGPVTGPTSGWTTDSTTGSPSAPGTEWTTAPTNEWPTGQSATGQTTRPTAPPPPPAG